MRPPVITLAALSLLVMIAIGTAGCAHVEPKFYAPLQPDGWSAQLVGITCRFSPDAQLDPATRTPVGDKGYYLYVLTMVGDWDYATSRSFLVSHARQPWGHCWLILESPEQRLECGLNGNFGREKPTYGDGVRQRLRDGDPNPVSYLWETMSDGEIEYGNGGRDPTFVWRIPITARQHQLIYRHVMHWKYDRIGWRANNRVDLVTEAAEVAGVNLIHRVRLTLPQDIKILGKTWHIWSDPQYRILEYSTADLVEVDVRHLTRFGIGSDVTDWYLDSDMAASRSKDRVGVGSSGGRAENAR